MLPVAGRSGRPRPYGRSGLHPGRGRRDFIAHLYGHEHFDEVRTGRGFTEISFLSSLCYQNETFAPKREFGTESEDAWSMVSIDRAARRIKVFRRGAGEDFSAAY